MSSSETEWSLYQNWLTLLLLVKTLQSILICLQSSYQHSICIINKNHCLWHLSKCRCRVCNFCKRNLCKWYRQGILPHRSQFAKDIWHTDPWTYGRLSSHSSQDRACPRPSTSQHKYSLHFFRYQYRDVYQLYFNRNTSDICLLLKLLRQVLLWWIFPDQWSLE